LASGLATPREAEQKFFGSFFQKRTACFYLFFYFLDGLGVTLLFTKGSPSFSSSLRKPVQVVITTPPGS
jgi:hypothetical protein